MKIKITKIVLFTLALFFSIKSQGQKSFEGVIKFSTYISTTNLAPPDFKGQLQAKYGDSIVMYYSENGNFKRIYKNSSESGNGSQLYLAKKSMLYITDKSGQIDSINVGVNSLKLIKEKKVVNEIIIGLDCDCHQYEAISIYDQHVILTYCFSKKTPMINPALYTEHIDFFLWDFYKMAKRPYLKFSIQTEEFEFSYVASELKIQSLDKKLFQLK